MTQNKFAISLQYLKKEVNNEDKHFFPWRQAWKLATNWYNDLMGIAKHYQSSQNSKFTMSLQYLKKEVRDEVDFCM